MEQIVTSLFIIIISIFIINSLVLPVIFYLIILLSWPLGKLYSWICRHLGIVNSAYRAAILVILFLFLTLWADMNSISPTIHWTKDAITLFGVLFSALALPAIIKLQLFRGVFPSIISYLKSKDGKVAVVGWLLFFILISNLIWSRLEDLTDIALAQLVLAIAYLVSTAVLAKESDRVAKFKYSKDIIVVSAYVLSLYLISISGWDENSKHFAEFSITMVAMPLIFSVDAVLAALLNAMGMISKNREILIIAGFLDIIMRPWGWPDFFGIGEPYSGIINYIISIAVSLLLGWPLGKLYSWICRHLDLVNSGYRAAILVILFLFLTLWADMNSIRPTIHWTKDAITLFGVLFSALALPAIIKLLMILRGIPSIISYLKSKDGKVAVVGWLLFFILISNLIWSRLEDLTDIALAQLVLAIAYLVSTAVLAKESDRVAKFKYSKDIIVVSAYVLSLYLISISGWDDNLRNIAYIFFTLMAIPLVFSVGVTLYFLSRRELLLIAGIIVFLIWRWRWEWLDMINPLAAKILILITLSLLLSWPLSRLYFLICKYLNINNNNDRAKIILILFAIVIVASHSYQLSTDLSTDAGNIITIGYNELVHGQELKANGHFIEAIDLTTKSIMYFIFNPMAHSTRATAYLYLNDYDKSLLFYRISDPFSYSTEVAYNKGLVYSKMNDFVKAIECIDVYLNKYPHDINALLKKGIAQKEINDNSAANNTFDEIIIICNSSDLNNATAHYRYAMALQMRGRLHDAIIEVNKSLEMDKDYTPSLELQMELLGSI